MMAKTNQRYPDSLNPFGSEDEDEQERRPGALVIKEDDYPDYLSPFGEEDGGAIDDYDNSLNPFGDEEEPNAQAIARPPSKIIGETNQNDDDDLGEGNPFAENEEDNESPAPLPSISAQHVTINNTCPPKPANQCEDGKISPAIDNESASSSTPPNQEDQSSIAHTSLPEPSEPPPVPLPRTKSLLKKEQRMRQQQQLDAETHQARSLSNTSSNSQSSVNGTTATTTTTTTLATNNNNNIINNNSNAPTAPISAGTFQRKKNKRNAPPVPINFKRQVSGSLDAIEEELNGIGDKLAIIEKESNVCQQTLKSHEEVEDQEFAMTRNKFIELIKRKNSIIRRQRELMYRKRELKLNQIHSDIEYELRMIGNKQMSHRTVEDEAREGVLIKKLLEIVQEKNDIVENLNRDSLSDSQDIEEALRRLNITTTSNGQPKQQSDDGKREVKKESLLSTENSLTKKKNCDKSSIAKLSKIATLLPKGGTIRDTMKMKRKQLFKKACDSHPVEHK